MSAIENESLRKALASTALVDATRAWLKDNNDTPALRRIVVENLAGAGGSLQRISPRSSPLTARSPEASSRPATPSRRAVGGLSVRPREHCR